MPWYWPSNLTILSRPVKARARRMACIVASLPEVARRAMSQKVRSVHQLARADLVLAGQAEADAQPHPLVDGVVDARVAVAQDGRPVAHAEVDVLVVVDVPDPAALAARDVDGVGAPVAEVAVDAAGHDPLGATTKLHLTVTGKAGRGGLDGHGGPPVAVRLRVGRTAIFVRYASVHVRITCLRSTS